MTDKRWFTAPAVIEAARAGHNVTCTRDGQDYHWSVNRSPPLDVLERAWRDAFYAAQREFNTGKVWSDCAADYGLGVNASLLATEASGTTPYDWSMSHQMPAGSRGAARDGTGACDGAGGMTRPTTLVTLDHRDPYGPSLVRDIALAIVAVALFVACMVSA